MITKYRDRYVGRIPITHVELTHLRLLASVRRPHRSVTLDLLVHAQCTSTHGKTIATTKQAVRYRYSAYA